MSLLLSFFILAVGGKKEVTFVGNTVGVHCYEYEGFVSRDILWPAGEKPSTVTGAFLFFKRHSDPHDPLS